MQSGVIIIVLKFLKMLGGSIFDIQFFCFEGFENDNQYGNNDRNRCEKNGRGEDITVNGNI